jgi:hypothetical protein
MRISIACIICGGSLASQREKDLQICFACRRYGLLNGFWPKKNLPSIFEVATYVSLDESADMVLFTTNNDRSQADSIYPWDG